MNPVQPKPQALLELQGRSSCAAGREFCLEGCTREFQEGLLTLRPKLGGKSMDPEHTHTLSSPTHRQVHG